MAITPTKTWEYSPDHSESGVSIQERNQKLWLRLKQMLTDTGAPGWVDDANGALANASSPWTVVASSNSVTADASDNWATISDIVGAGAGVAHSWIHLRQVDYFGVGDHLNLLMAVENSSNCTLGYVAFNRGASGWNADGTTTNRPTVEVGTAPIVIRDGTTTSGTYRASDEMWGNDSVNDTRVLQFRMSDDGQAGMWLLFAGGNCLSCAGWQRDEGGPSRTNDWSCWYGSTDDTVESMTWDTQWNTSNWVQTLDDSNIERAVYVAVPCFSVTEIQLPEANNGLDGSRFFGQAQLISDAMSACVGVWTDIWWGSISNVSGDGSPTSSPVVFRSVGHLVIPWPEDRAMLVS